MKVRDHLIFGGVASLGLYPFWGTQSLLFFTASVMIDLDHYLDYLIHNRFRDFSIRKMLILHDRFFGEMGRPNFLVVNLLHTLEFLTIVYLMALFLSSLGLTITILGLLFHLLLDTISLARHRATFKRAFSIVEYLVRRNRMMRRGLYPQEVYEEVLGSI
jgi:hypothetical protein